MITKKITEVQNFANGDLGTIIQVQGDEIGQTDVGTLKQDITNSVVSELMDSGGVSLNLINMKGTVPTYADLALITPTPELNDAYQVEADGLVYVYTESGFQADGDGFVVQPEPNGVVEEGNTQAVSGDEVFNYVDYENLYEKMELPKPFPETTLINILDNNNFDSEWVGSNYLSEGVLNNVFKWRATAVNGRIQGRFPSVTGNVFFISIWVKSTANIVLSLPGTPGNASYSGSGNWEKLSIRVVGVVDVITSIRVTDVRTSDWDSVEVKKGVVINLTESFGSGLEPDLLEMNEMLSALEDDWFETNYSFKEKLTTNNMTFANINGEMQMVKISDLVDNSQERLFQNVFGKSVPDNFKEKLFNGDDVEIVCVGDSLTGLIGTSTAFTEEQCQHLPAGMTNNHWTYQLWDRLNLNKPINNRIDTDFFTNVGTFSKITGGKFNLPAKSGEYSASDLTFQSGDLNASSSFILNVSQFKKCNIVYSANQDGCLSEIVITQGNGIIEASFDKQNWVEANNLEVDQNTIPIDAPYDEDLAYYYGVAIHQRHRRIWLRVKEGVTSNVNITYRRKSTDTDISRFFYIWGVEMWNQQGIFVTNLGRGGRNTLLLNNNISDISSRNPDLLIYEMPLANETNKQTMIAVKDNYLDYFINGGTQMPSLKSISNDFTKFGVLVIMPHGRSDYFIGNQSVVFGDGNSDQIINNIKCNSIYNYTNDLVKDYKNVITINLMQQLYNEGLSKNMTIEDFLKGSSDNSTITTDNIHLNDYGSFLWVKYLAPLFQ